MKYLKNLIRIPVLLTMVIPLLGTHMNGQPLLEILPLGNSITRGSMCLNGSISNCDGLGDAFAIGYRLRLYDLMIGAGYNIDYVGSNHFGYSLMSDSDNGGFSGIRDEWLADIMESGTSSYTGQVTTGAYLNSFPADIILLHIGTNDVMAGPTQYNTVYDVGRILDAIDDYETAHNRPILVLLARIISMQDYPCNTNIGVKTYNNKLVTMAQNRINSGDKIIIVDMECGAGLDYFSDLMDQAHPNQTGYDKMADKWFEVINGINTAPVVTQIPNQSVDRGSSFTQIYLDNYVSDTEDDPEDMTWSIYPYNPEHFQVTINENRVATVTPKDPDWSGSETIEFVAMDMGKVVAGLQKTDNSITQFTVNWIPEILGQQPISIPENTPAEITLDHLIIVEPEKAPPGVQVILEAGDHYTVNGATITPAYNYSGPLTVPVKLVDNGRESNTYDLSIEVNQVNFPPVITSSPVLSANTNEQYLYAIIANDPDPDDVLTYSASQKPYWLQVNETTGVVSGTPSSGDAGEYNITLAVSDGSYTVPQSYTLEVVYMNHPPVIVTVPGDSATVSVVYAYGMQATDAEGDQLYYFASNIPGWLDFNTQSHVLIGVPGKDDIGLNLVVLGVSDLNDTTYQAYTLYVASTTGFRDAEAGQAIRIYPNPASDLLLLEIAGPQPDQDALTFTLFDLKGKQLLHTLLTGSSSELRLRESGLTEGIYLYRVTVGEGGDILQTGKIILKF